MDYEILLWLEPAFHALNTFLTTFLIFSGLVVFGLVFSTLAGCWEEKKTKDNIVRWTKRLVIACGIAVFFLVGTAPLAEFTDVYKRILVYRGINSVLVDKATMTADKALDLLNKKIDTELGMLNTDKQ